MKSHSHDCCVHSTPSPQWMERLRQQAGRVTQSRQVVLEALVRLQRPSTPKQIVDAVGPQSCDLATVYRSLSLFEQLGLVHRIDLGDGLARFEIADDDPTGHQHHHLLCNYCDRIVKLDDCVLANVEADLARRYGYRGIKHRLEFFGTCPECQGQAANPRAAGNGASSFPARRGVVRAKLGGRRNVRKASQRGA